MTALPDSLCYLDGDFLPLNQAKVSVMDRGFLFGDGAYESIPVYKRRMFRFDDHMARFERSLGKLAQVGLGSAEAVYVAVPKGEGDRLKTRIERTDPLVAPLAKGQRVGSLKVTTASGTAIATIALTVLEDVPQAGLFGRAWDAIRLWIK